MARNTLSTITQLVAVHDYRYQVRNAGADDCNERTESEGVTE